MARTSTPALLGPGLYENRCIGAHMGTGNVEIVVFDGFLKAHAVAVNQDIDDLPLVVNNAAVATTVEADNCLVESVSRQNFLVYGAGVHHIVQVVTIHVGQVPCVIRMPHIGELWRYRVL